METPNDNKKTIQCMHCRQPIVIAYEMMEASGTFNVYICMTKYCPRIGLLSFTCTLEGEDDAS